MGAVAPPASPFPAVAVVDRVAMVARVVPLVAMVAMAAMAAPPAAQGAASEAVVDLFCSTEKSKTARTHHTARSSSCSCLLAVASNQESCMSTFDIRWIRSSRCRRLRRYRSGRRHSHGARRRPRGPDTERAGT